MSCFTVIYNLYSSLLIRACHTYSMPFSEDMTLIMPLKQLLISTVHRVKYLLVIRLYINGDTNLKYQESREYPSAINDQHLKILGEQNPRQNVKEIFHTMCVKISTISDHLKKIIKAKKLDNGVPREFSEYFKVCSMLFLRNNQFLDRTVTCNENGSFMII